MNSTLRGWVFIVAAAVALLASGATVRGQALGPLLPSRVMEGGLAWRHLERTVWFQPYSTGPAREQVIDQSDVSAFARYGVTSTATLAFELSVTPGDIAFEDGDGKLYIVGAAIQLEIWSNDQYALSFGFHVASFFWRNDRPETCDYDEQLLEWSGQLQRSWSAGSIDGDVWVGPVVSYFSVSAQQPCDSRLQQPVETTGGLIGASGRLKDHVGIDAQLMWIETADLNVGLFYRF